jgi:1-acyl-sn-glycerol-3-phosphate acyltransferase
MPLEPLPKAHGPGHWWRIVTTIPLALALFVTLLLFNLLQMASFLVIPVSRRLFRRINRELANTWWGWCVRAVEGIRGTRLELGGDPVPPRENAIVISNHQQMPDIVAVMMLAHRKDRLGDLKFFVKEELKWVPGMGWGMVFLGCVFVRRDWTRDQARIRRAFAAIVDERLPVWLVTYPEGTRLTAAKLERARRYARERGLEPPRHVLVPRTKGFAAAVQALRNHVAAVYDLTVGYEEGVPTLWQLALGQVRRIHLHVRRFPIAGLPEGAEALSTWLLERFREKDELLDRFYREGRFEPAGRLPT